MSSYNYKMAVVFNKKIMFFYFSKSFKRNAFRINKKTRVTKFTPTIR